VDFKGNLVTGEQTCYPLTITDAHSRYLLCCQGLLQTGVAHVRPMFEKIFREYGLPVAVRSDNGPPFATRTAGGLSKLSIWWIHLGIMPDRIEPGKPQQNGRHERMHLTLKNETANPPASTFGRQQIRFNEFQKEYNELRPHEALDMQTPSSRYIASARAYPSRLPEIEYPDDWQLRRVCGCGVFHWHHQKVFISQTLHGETIALQAIDDRYWQTRFATIPLGIFDSWKRRILTSAQQRRLDRKRAAQGQPLAISSLAKPPSAALQEASPATDNV
jgi:hypothetical protein